jgi:hypothetical protein
MNGGRPFQVIHSTTTDDSWPFGYHVLDSILIALDRFTPDNTFADFVQYCSDQISREAISIPHRGLVHIYCELSQVYQSSGVNMNRFVEFPNLEDRIYVKMVLKTIVEREPSYIHGQFMLWLN